MRFRFRPRVLAARTVRVLGAVLLTAALACGWEFGLPGDSAGGAADAVRIGVAAGLDTGGAPESAGGTAAGDPLDSPKRPRPEATSARPVPPPTDIVAPLPDRSRPDTIGVLLERELGREVAGVEVDDYLLWLPPGLEDEKGEWPLLLWLHGRSLRGEDLDQLKRYGPPALLDRGVSLPFVVVAPQLPPDGSWADLDPVAAIVEDVIAKYPVDRDRLYLLGFSMGGGGAYRMAFEHGEMFSAVISIAGHTPAPTPERIRAVSRMPFLAIHGPDDRLVPMAPAQRMAEAMRAAGASRFEFRTEPGRSHGQLERLTRDEELYGWLLSHRRSAPTAPVRAR